MSKSLLSSFLCIFSKNNSPKITVILFLAFWGTATLFSTLLLLLSHLRLCVTPWTGSRQASLSIIISWSLLELMSIESVMASNHLILCHPLLLLPSIFPSIRVFSNESALHIKGLRWQHHFTFPPAVHKGSNFSTSYQHWLVFVFLTAAILVGVKWYLNGFDVHFPNNWKY